MPFLLSRSHSSSPAAPKFLFIPIWSHPILHGSSSFSFAPKFDWGCSRHGAILFCMGRTVSPCSKMGLLPILESPFSFLVAQVLLAPKWGLLPIWSHAFLHESRSSSSPAAPKFCCSRFWSHPFSFLVAQVLLAPKWGLLPIWSHAFLHESRSSSSPAAPKFCCSRFGAS